jgi:hypothetical protein
MSVLAQYMIKRQYQFAKRPISGKPKCIVKKYSTISLEAVKRFTKLEDNNKLSGAFKIAEWTS